MSTRIVSRSVYVDKLRRAFLLRAHPDRFRLHTELMSQQTHLLKALSQRMALPDFQDYTSYCSNPTANHPEEIISYHIEHRDGSLLPQTLNVNDSVEGILSSLSEALKLSGAVPPTPPPTIKEDGKEHYSRLFV